MDQHGKETLCMILCALWGNRNNVLWNRKSKPAHVCLETALDFLGQFQRANEVYSSLQHSSLSSAGDTWSYPVHHMLKLNVDASVRKDVSSVEVG